MSLMVTLNEVEQRLARFLATSRHMANRREGVPNERIGPQSDEETDLEGIAAEIAYCKIHNLYPDMQLEKREAADCYSFEHGSIDVKGTTRPNGHLLVRLQKVQKGAVDTYALMIGRFPSYRFAGWEYAKNVLRDETIKDFGHGPTHAIHHTRLKT